MAPPTGATAVTRLFGLGTAVPPHSAAQADVGAFMARVVEAAGADGDGGPPRRARLIRRLYAESGVARRHSVLADYTRTDPATFDFFPPNWALEPFPTTAARMAVYRDASVDLAAAAAGDALAEAGVAPGEVSHLVVSTCTGFFAPGPDIALLRRLGLAPTVARTVIGFMGCNAGFNGLRAADDIVRARPEAVVLQVCVELCSLHFQRDAAAETLIANCLFADGASAAVWAAEAGRPGGLASVVGTRSAVHHDSADQMGWRIGDHGFVMTLSDRVPETLATAIGPFVDALRDDGGTPDGGVAGWAIHPGGRRIVERLGRALALGDAELASAYGVLRDHGNMSSATLLFVLRRELDRLWAASRPGDAATGPAPAGDVVALGFGPGLSLEGAVLRLER